MSPAIVKTISLLLMIALGYVLRNKIKGKDQKEGIKTIILSLALPATIFIALLKIDFQASMILIPILALVFNLILYLLADKLPLNNALGIPQPQYRAAILLLPSLAPGLSCFPFILEYSGEVPLALAALADIGNKVFVLIIAYMIAMKWYFENHKLATGDGSSKIKDLLRALAGEPVNLVIMAAIIMLAAGLNFDALPAFITTNIDRLSAMMTPLVLLFIGISMKLTRQQARVIVSLLTFRSAVAFLLSSVVLVILPQQPAAIALLLVVFPQSACSFWPFAHMSAVNRLEEKVGAQERHKVFDLDFAMNILACSLPFSVILVLIIYSTGEFFISVSNILLVAGLFFAFSMIPVVMHARFFKVYRNKVREVPGSK